jgi:hypothetical protein
VEAEETEVVLRGEDSHREAVHGHEARASIERLEGPVAQAPEPRVEIHGAARVRETGQESRRDLELWGPDVEIDIAVGSEPLLRVEPGHGPALGENGFESRRPQGIENPDDPLPVEGRLQGVEPVGLTKSGRRRPVRQVGAAQTPPDEARRSRAVEEGSDPL